MQAYIYSNRFLDDRWGLKIFVAYIVGLDTAHQVLVTYIEWHYVVDSFMMPLNLLFIHWSATAFLALSAWVRFSVQLFYTHRIWALTRNYFVCGTIVLFGCLNMGFSGYFIKQLIVVPLWSDVRKQTWATDISLGCSIVADILIAATMTIVLRRRSSGYTRTKGMIQTLIVYAVGTGTLTVILSLLTLVLVATSDSFAAQVLYNILSKLYTSSALISLNARSTLRADLPQSLIVFGDSDLPSASLNFSGSRSAHGSDQPSTVIDGQTSGTTTKERHGNNEGQWAHGKLTFAV